MDIIRKFYDMDLEKVMQIWYDCNCEVHDFIPISYWDRSFGYVSRLIPKSEVYVYEINGLIVGFIGVDEGYIEGLFVHKDYRGLGVGTKLSLTEKNSLTLTRMKMRMTSLSWMFLKKITELSVFTKTVISRSSALFRTRISAK